jgi:hypothetical protein
MAIPPMVLDRLLHLFESTRRDTPNSSASSASVIGSSARRRPRRCAVAFVKYAERIGQRLAALVEIFASGEQDNRIEPRVAHVAAIEPPVSLPMH